ncbi:hypothetical protein C8J55DRAFT_603779 [Lentinula edodes]|uniref:Fungal-type protein kinase domain-containing protein n=1 Tax=Lentinula lateritia TaxID=40482 RepID=A0A9W9AS97_9AGAR|nr:hypothetical protein C8J55DRAFT_603779 [Lentinula edodes]
MPDFIDYLRSEVVTNFPVSIPGITFDLFKQAALPNVEESSIKKAHQKLREWGILIDEGWKGINFGADEQEQQQETEEEEEEELKVTMEIEVEEVEVQKESLFYAPLFEGLNNLLSEGDHSHYKADINGLLTKTTAVPPIAEGAEYECDVLMTGKLKKKSTPNTVDDSCLMRHIMGADPTRRFMFGLTIDKFNIRLWFFSRSHVFVTEAMNLHTDAKNLIYFALSLSRACREELGYDPTVTRVQGKNRTGPRYLFTIDSKQYITTEAITVRKAKFLLGSATRVFKVQQFLNDEGDLDSEVKIPPTELETRSAIEANVQKVNVVPNLDRSAFDRYFVKIEACEKVQTLPSDVKHFTIATQSPATAVHLARLYRRTYAPKVHCRQLSEYAGEPLHQITNWVIVLKAFESLIFALSYMHSAGFVHRDISACECRIQPEVQPRSWTSDVKRGTQFFMPVEVVEGKYLFRPKKYVSKYKSAPSFPFRYHYIHDLESVLWVFIYLLMTKWPILGLSPSEEQQKARDEVFSHIFIFKKHKEILDGKETMFDLVSESMPEILYSNWECALKFAGVVEEKYRALQQSLPIDFKNAFHPSLYSDWQQAFVHCATEGWAGAVTHRGRAKRPAEDDLEKETKKSKET